MTNPISYSAPLLALLLASTSGAALAQSSPPPELAELQGVWARSEADCESRGHSDCDCLLHSLLLAVGCGVERPDLRGEVGGAEVFAEEVAGVGVIVGHY